MLTEPPLTARRRGGKPVLPFPALSPTGRASRAEEFTGISGEKENNLIKGPWSQAHGETGLVGFFSFNQCQVDFIFREVMILKIKGGGVRKAPTGIWGRAPISYSAGPS